MVKLVLMVQSDVLNSISVDDAVTRATLPNISLGFSINIAGIDGGRVLNIETHSTGC